MRVIRRVSALFPCLLALWVCGCAALPPGKRDPRDPWERMNRASYRFNDKFDRVIARPLARGYQKITPNFVQTGIRHVIDNADYPVVMVNDLLQGEIKPFLADTLRFLCNTTIGIGGLFDPATPMGLEKNDRDTGQTLGKWGVPKGPYLVVPFLGPYDVRDGFGSIGDEFMRPRHYINNNYVQYGVWLLDKVDLRARFLPTDRIIDNAYDPYAFIRNAYLQNRDFKVKGAKSEGEQQREEQMLDEAGETEAAPAASPPTPTGAPPPANSAPANSAPANSAPATSAPPPPAPPPPGPER